MSSREQIGTYKFHEECIYLAFTQYEHEHFKQSNIALVVATSY